MILSLMIRREFDNRVSKYYLFSLLSGLVVYSGSMAILESSIGSSVGYSLYAPPMQPLLFMFIIFGIAGISFREKKTV